MNKEEVREFFKPNNIYKKIILGGISLLSVYFVYSVGINFVNGPLSLIVWFFLFIFFLSIFIGIVGYNGKYYSKYEKEYNIPWKECIKYIIVEGILFTILFVILIVAYIPFKNIAGEFLVFGIVYYFIFSNGRFSSLTFFNLGTSPVRKWIVKNIKCPICGEGISNCDWVGPATKFKFKVYCKSCHKFYFIETGLFNKTLRFVD